MPRQVTFDSYAAAVATATDAWSPDDHPAMPDSADAPYGVDAPSDAGSPDRPEDQERYTTFGCVEYRPRE